MYNGTGRANIGLVAGGRGSVVIVRFDSYLPSLRSELRAGKAWEIVMEVLAQTDVHHVRCIALTDIPPNRKSLRPVYDDSPRNYAWRG